MEFDPKNLPDGLKRAFTEGRQSALKFAENFLIDPTLGTPFKATYPQKYILSSQKRDIWICVHRRAGKCVAGDTMVLDPVTLRPTPISRASRFKKTLCYDFGTSNVVWADCDWIDSGLKKCLRFNLNSGLEITLSDDHPVYCKRRGWVQACQIKDGDKILAPSSIPVFGTIEVSKFEIETALDQTFALYSIPDAVFSYTKECLRTFIAEFFFERGRIHHNQDMIAFMNWNKAISKDFHHLLLRFEIESRIDEDGNLFIEKDRTRFMNLAGFDFPIESYKVHKRWETVGEIVRLGTRPVYDLSVEHDDHNFIGTDVVLHNSYSMTILALWHAITKGNQKICVFAPSSTQINEFFDVIDKWLVKNDFLNALQDPTGGNHKNPQKRTFVNGSTIQGYLLGLTGGLERSKLGITADVVIIDEAQELDAEDWRVVGPIMKGDKFRADKIRCYIAGTIHDPTTYYYEKIYKIKVGETEDRIFIPINKNVEYSDEEVERMRQSTPISQWTTEYLLEIAEADSAVFKKKDIEEASKFDWEYGLEAIDENKIRFVGVDWDKVQAGTNIAVFQYDMYTKTVQLIYREEVARDQFTYTNAVQRIIDIYQAYKPELTVTDQGQGEVQWELLQLESQRYNLGLAERLIKKAFNEKIEVPNPQTFEIENKPIKPFLVGLLQQKLQQNLFKFPSHDETLFNQLVSYRVVRQTLQTTKYTTHNEHIIDCCLFAMYGIWYLFENHLEQKYGSDSNTFKVYNDNLWPVEDEVKNQFWNQLEGPRFNLPGSKLPRTGFDDVDRRNANSFFIDDDWGMS